MSVIAALAAAAASPSEVRARRFKNSRFNVACGSNELRVEEAQTATAPPLGALIRLSARLSV
jgi:hypothetical protein